MRDDTGPSQHHLHSHRRPGAVGGRLLRQPGDAHPQHRPHRRHRAALRQFLLRLAGVLAEPGVVPDRADAVPARRARLDSRRQLRRRRSHLPGGAARLHRPAGAGGLDLRHQRQVAPRQQRPAATRLQPLVRAREGRRRIQRRADDPQRRTVQRPRLRDQRHHRRRAGIHRPPRRRCGAVLPERALHRPAQPVDRPSAGHRGQLRRLPVRLLPAGGDASMGQLAVPEVPRQPRSAQGLLRRRHPPWTWTWAASSTA